MTDLTAMRAALATEWKPHFEAAAREGWFLSDCEGSMYGPLQVQKVDDPEGVGKEYGFTVPDLDSDDEAWHIVKNGTGPHHVAALDLLRRFNAEEYKLLSTRQ